MCQDLKLEMTWTLEHVGIHTPKESRVFNFVLKFLTILIGCVHLLGLSRFDLGHATDKIHRKLVSMIFVRLSASWAPEWTHLSVTPSDIKSLMARANN